MSVNLNHSMELRPATPADAPHLLEIYRPYVEKTAISFELALPTPADFCDRICAIMDRYPYYVAEEAGEILGYAYASAFIHREAYDHSVEMSIYLDQAACGQGLGRALYERLERELAAMGVTNANACIAYPVGEDPYLTLNSVDFHKHLGYRMVGRFHKCGYKFGRWYDMVWMEKMIADYRQVKEGIIPWPQWMRVSD